MFFTEAQKKELKEWVKTFIIAISIYLIISIFVFPVKVDGSSMNPTFNHSDFLFINRGYLNKDYKYGDVIVFNCHPLQKTLIKRVIGVPGDTVKIENGEVFINNKKIDEPYINNATIETLEITVKENTYFVMGDNRQNSLDSRFEIVGLVNKSDILGKVIFELFPKPRIIK